jgi:transcriptional regulator with XRE-family HTH domain
MQRSSEIIKQLMQFHTIREISDATGYHPNTIGAWRNGKNEPPFYAVQCIAQACGFKLEFKRNEQ